MTPDTINAVKEALLPVAEKMGQGAEYGWEIIVKGQIAEGWAMLFLGIITSIGAVIFALSIRKFALHFNEVSDGASIVLGAVFGTVFTLGMLAIAVDNIYNGLFHLLAPEYKALEFLLSLTK